MSIIIIICTLSSDYLHIRFVQHPSLAAGHFGWILYHLHEKKKRIINVQYILISISIFTKWYMYIDIVYTDQQI